MVFLKVTSCFVAKFRSYDVSKFIQNFSPVLKKEQKRSSAKAQAYNSENIDQLRKDPP